MERKGTNQTVQESTTVWCGGCGAWFRTSVYRMINGETDGALVDAFLEKGFAGINRSNCGACGWEYVAEERLGVHYPARRQLLLVVPDGLRHRAQRMRANFIEDVAQAPGQMVDPYLLEPTLVGGQAELAKILEVGHPVDEVDEASVDGSVESLSGSSASLSSDSLSPPPQEEPRNVRRHTKSLNLLAELLSDEEDTEDSVAPGLVEGPPPVGLPVSEDRIRVDVTVDPFLENEEESFSVPISDKVENRLRVLLDDDIVVAPVEHSLTDATQKPIDRSAEFTDTAEGVIDDKVVESAEMAESVEPVAAEATPEAVEQDGVPADDEREAAHVLSEPPVAADGNGDAEHPLSSGGAAVNDGRPTEQVAPDFELDADDPVRADQTLSEDEAEDALKALAQEHQTPEGALDDSQTELDGGELLREVIERASEEEAQSSEEDGSKESGTTESASSEPAPNRLLSMVNGNVRAYARVASELAEGAQTDVPELRFQRHKTEDGVVVCLTLVVSTGEMPASETIIWPIERTDENTRILHQLAEDFAVDVCLDAVELEEEQVELRLSPALEGNVAQVLEDGLSTLSEQAFERLSAPDFELLGTMAHSFSEDSFSQLLTAAEARLAVGIVNYWNSAEQRDYLLDVQSFPRAWWDGIVRRVVEAAYQFGLVVQGNLRAEMRRVGRTETDAELLGVLIAHFAEVNLNLRPNELDPLDLWENWDQLLSWANSIGFEVDAEVEQLASRALSNAERFANDDHSEDESYAAIEVSLADAIDVASFGPARFRGASLHTVDSGSTLVIEPAMAELSDDELLAALSETEQRAGATVHLVGRGVTDSSVRIFDAIKQMTAPELGVVVPSLLPVSDAFVSLFRSVLFSEDEALRLSAAMLLAEVGDERALNPVLAMMLEPDEERWELLAETAARLGPMVIQPGLSRAAIDETSAYRIAVLLGYVGANEPDVLEGLEASQEDPAVVACIERARSVAQALGRVETPPFAHRLTTVLETLTHASIHG